MRNTSAPEVNSKPGTHTVQLSARPALPLSDQQRETWLCSKNIMDQMQQALSRLDSFGREEGPLTAELRKTAAACARAVTLPDLTCNRDPLPGTTAECPLPSVYLGKLVPTSSTPDVGEVTYHAVPAQPGTLTPRIEYQGECNTPLDDDVNRLLDKPGGRGDGEREMPAPLGETERQTDRAHPVEGTTKTISNDMTNNTTIGKNNKRVRASRGRSPTDAFKECMVPPSDQGVEAEAPGTVPARSDKKSRSNNGSRKFRGVTHHKKSGRYEAHIWVNDLKKQVYLGGYATEALAAEAFDILQVKVKGANAVTNFPIENYDEIMETIDSMDVTDVIACIKREADTFSRGASRFRGVTKAATDSSLWESRIGIHGSKHIYLGVFETDSGAARAYDRALIRIKGNTVTTNFRKSEYADAIEDYQAFQRLVKEGDERALAVLSSDEPKYVRMLEEYVRGGMEALIETSEWPKV